MDQERFREILQFAMDKEMEARDFYRRASETAKFSGTKELFTELSKQEEGHWKLIADLNTEKIEGSTIQSIPDLKISDYLVDAELRSDIPYADILRIAMKREERSIKLYSDLNASAADESLKKLFSFLIQEETRHKYRLEKIYDDEILK